MGYYNDLLRTVNNKIYSSSANLTMWRNCDKKNFLPTIIPLF